LKRKKVKKEKGKRPLEKEKSEKVKRENRPFEK